MRSADGVFMSVDMKCGLGEPELISRKELAYPGEFVKLDENNEVQFELPVDEALLEHWVRTFNQMHQDGIPVPVPIGHTNSPEARRGTVVRMAVEPSEHPNRVGQPALFCYVRWAKPEYKEQFKESDVSLFMPHQFTSGIGKTYHRPIRHVAITDYPVVPALGKFTDMASPEMAKAAAFELSLVSCSEEGIKMASECLVRLAEKLGVEVPEGADDEQIESAIEQAWSGQVGGEGEGEGEGEESFDPGEGGEGEGEEFNSENGVGGGPPPEIFDDGEEEEPKRRHDRNYEPPPSMSFNVPVSIANQLVRSRKLELSALVNARKITPAVAKEFEKQYCTPKAVAFALSHEQMYPDETGDDFDKLMVALSLNAASAPIGEKTGHQASRAHGDNGNPVLKDAEARAKKHEARHRRYQ